LKRKWPAVLVGAALLCALGLYLANGHLGFAPPAGARPELLAHRGIAQRFDPAGVGRDTCTATRMLPSNHRYLENTIPSMRAGFAAGADVVELDVHPTTDGQFAVFHDWTLDCRTDGHGVTREHSMAELKKLDVGYGYTADGGKTYPFRGTGVGLMPSLAEVLDAFPDRRFLINVKSRDAEEGVKLAAVLGRLPASRRAQLMVYGGDAPIAEVRRRAADVQTMSRESLKACLLRYVGYGWAGIVPAACERMVVFVPLNIAPWLWGWPHRLDARMRGAGSSVFVIGPYHGGDFSSGIDTAEQLARLPAGYAGGVMTDEIEAIAAQLRAGAK
jgi:glycerophosphoryl diester phosphodiesterase